MLYVGRPGWIGPNICVTKLSLELKRLIEMYLYISVTFGSRQHKLPSFCSHPPYPASAQGGACRAVPDQHTSCGG